MKVLVVSNYPRSLVNLRGHLIQTMRERGHEVHVTAPAIHEDRVVVEQLEPLGVSMHSLRLERTGLNPVSDLVACMHLVRRMRQIEPDLVFCYTIKPVVFGLLAAGLCGVPRRHAMMTGLGYAFTGEARGKRRVVRRVVRELYKPALRQATGMFFQNPDDLALFQGLRLLPEHVRVTMVNGSGVDTAHFDVAPVPGGPLSFLLIARLLGDKGIREYVDAARAVRAAHPHTAFHLVGGVDPNPEGIQAAEVRQWEQEGVLTWHGEVDDVRPFIEASHVYVLPSYREGTPRTVLESMAMGRPVITTDAPGCRETVVDGHNGFLVQVRSSESLATAMTRFIEEPGLVASMGANARQVAVDKYDVHAVNAVMLAEMGLDEEAG